MTPDVTPGAGADGRIDAAYFDGRVSRRWPVTLTIREGRAMVAGEGVHQDAPLAAVVITPPIGRSPRWVRFPDGAACEVVNLERLGAALAAAGCPMGPVERLEARPSRVVAAAAGVAALLVVTYLATLPWLAEQVARRIPDAMLESVEKAVLVQLDRTVFRPSELPGARKMSLLRGMTGLRLPEDARRVFLGIEFRASRMGPNAVTLPSGLVIVTDDLVRLARDDREIFAVIAHEAGHVRARHGVRQLLQGSTVALFVAWFLGDLNAIALAAPAALLQTRYSRDFEREADACAVELLSGAGIPTGYLVDILERMSASTAEGLLPDYLSTHPPTAERLQTLRAAAAGDR
jgi:hypothetical protein